MATVTTNHDDPIICTPATVWSFAAGNISMTESEFDLSARFIPVIMNLGASKSTGFHDDDGDEEAVSMVRMSRRQSLELIDMGTSFSRRASQPRNRRQSLELSDLWASSSHVQQPQEAVPVTIEEEENSEHEDYEVPLKSSSSMVEDSSEHEDIDIPLASSPSPDTPQRKRISYSDEWDEVRLTPSDLLSKLMPEKVKAAQARISLKQQEMAAVASKASADEDASEHEDIEVPLKSNSSDVEDASEHEDIEIPLASSPSPATPQRKRISYSSEWDDIRLTPTDLLAKLMPEKVQAAQARISLKQQDMTPRAQLYRLSRSEVRSVLRNSLVKLDPLDGDSGHTSVTMTSAASLNDFGIGLQESTREDQEKWGARSLSLSDLKEETKPKKKKTKRKSTTKSKSDTKKEKEESSTPKAKKSPKRSSVKKSSSSSTLASTNKEEKRRMPKRKSGSKPSRKASPEMATSQ